MTDRVDHRLEVVLPERGHVDLALQHVERVLEELLRQPAVGVEQALLRRGSQLLPHSIVASLTPGKRESMPWPIADQIVSVIGRSCVTMIEKMSGSNGNNSSSVRPSHSLA